ncbi:MAG TPA: molybdopterin-dependent oxidoreductase [Pirellulales bacterium]|nr:molybdopterin-dependent oxidoreductase [Pirellulales bacterium]
MTETERFLAEHTALTRRYFLRLGIGSAAIVLVPGRSRAEDKNDAAAGEKAAPPFTRLDSYLTPPDDFEDISRGDPVPHTLSEERKRAVGLTRDTWQLEVISDPDNPVTLRKPLSREKGTAIDFATLMSIAEKSAVRFPKIMTCLNLGCPLGMGIWEGVPLRELIWLTKPNDALRRVFYYGYHNDDPKQIFRSSLPIGRVLEDPFDLPPVILCYKVNGQWLSGERGGPVRIVVPEAYGFKCVKWITHVVLTNLAGANDTYANENNDIDSPLKTFAATISAPRKIKAGESTPLSGYAQVGIGGLSKVQFWLQPEAEELPAGDPYFAAAPWTDAEILPAPKRWGGGIADDRIPAGTYGFDDASGEPRSWPMRLTKVHWAALVPPLAPGKYTLRCRAVDAAGHGQPMPRPFRKSGHAAIEQVAVVVQ